MVDVLIKTDSHYTVNRHKIRDIVKDFLAEKKVKSHAEVSISIVGDRMMKKLNKKFRNLDETTDVLSFPLNDEKKGSDYIDAPDGILRLGDIIISYPQVIEEATEDNVMVDDKINELVVHGLLHLMGQHHE
ncbi:rRNA maturation RNase YbeY [Candidatus Microgenomates bacterium]|nr:rRNA maturation RNase YbeY [Candidatus Microgenomates bacterium]